jgi:LuxR family transcriptional regulator, maltose regulon positive regulatory protein
MDSSFLATKLQIPPALQHLVARDRLINLLERDVTSHKLTLVTAPAGYGKTTLVAQWARTTRLPVGWLTIGKEENDTDRFFRYFYAAWRTIQPEIESGPVDILLGGVAPDRDAVLAAFINVGYELPDHVALVLDDADAIDDPENLQALTSFLDHLPPNLHLVMTGRGTPSLPLARYRARQELLEIDADQLRFAPEEAEKLLNATLTLGLGSDDLVNLNAQLEGWAAGLHLVSLTLRDRERSLDALRISGQHRHIADYLGQEVLARTASELRRFLMQTSILDRLCASLCESVTGRTDSQMVLQEIESAGLFLMPLDNRREWFRYHSIFAEVLEEQLHKLPLGEVNELHRSAARWYLDNDLVDRAFDHAVAGNDIELVSHIVDSHVITKLECGEFKEIARWIETIPNAWYEKHPILELSQIAYSVFTGAFDVSLVRIDSIEARLQQVPDKERSRNLAKTAVARCAIACFRNDLPLAEHYANQALTDLDASDFAYRANAHHALADTYRRNGRWEEARTHYLQLLTLTDDPDFRLRSAHVYGALADLELTLGRLRLAGDYWRKALEAIQQQSSWGRLPLPMIGWVYLRTAELLYEWNRLEEAKEYVSRGMVPAEVGGDVRALIAGHLLASRLALTGEKLHEAETALDLVRALIEQAMFPDLISRFERMQLELWLAQDRLRAAVTWADDVLDDVDLNQRPERALAILAIARVLIVKRDARSGSEALTLLGALLPEAERTGRIGLTIETLALRALAQWSGDEQAEAMESIERALRQAEPEGYVRLFVDLGLPMGRLLQDAHLRGVMPDYIGRLLAAFDLEAAVESSADSAIPEPLTRREQEVLNLLAAGLTNREVAEKLVVSPETVKKHTGNIYGKLGVGHRTEAVAKARSLDILD